MPSTTGFSCHDFLLAKIEFIQAEILYDYFLFFIRTHPDRDQKASFAHTDPAKECGSMQQPLPALKCIVEDGC
jgi:hypothetical protein